MTSILDDFRSIILLVVTTIITAISPIMTAFVCLFVGFLFNFMTGLITDIHVNKTEFRIKKGFEAIIMLTFFFALIYYIYQVASSMGDIKLAQEAVKYITYIVSYFYLVNILKNAKLIFPKNKAIAFLYMFLTTEIFNRLKKMIGFSADEEQKGNDTLKNTQNDKGVTADN